MSDKDAPAPRRVPNWSKQCAAIIKPLGIATFVLALGLLSCRKEKELPIPRIALSPASLDFGSVLQGETVHVAFNVENVGETNVLLTQVRSACPCTHVTIEKNYLLPGESAELKVIFDTSDYPGMIRQILIVSCADPRAQAHYLPLTGTVSPGLLIEPSLLHLPEGPGGQKVELHSILRNLSGRTITIKSAKVVGGVIRVTAGGRRGFPLKLKPGGEIDLKITAEHPAGGKSFGGKVLLDVVGLPKQIHTITLVRKR